MTYHTATLDCPRCDDQREVEFEIEPGQERTWHQPGYPAVARIVGEGETCGCELTLEEWDRLESENQDRMFDALEREKGRVGWRPRC